MTITKLEAKVATVVFNQMRNAWESYEADCAEWAEQGYRPHYCFHGRDMWVDHDCVCGICEDLGYYSFDAVAYRRMALNDAQSAVAEMDTRINMMIQLQVKGAPVKLMDFNDWVWQPVTALGYDPAKA